MKDEFTRPQINISKIAVGGGIAGAIFAIGSMLIFLTGLPTLRYFFAAAIVFGCAVALLLRLFRRETPGRPWIAPATETRPAETRAPDRPTNLPSIARLQARSC